MSRNDLRDLSWSLPTQYQECQACTQYNDNPFSAASDQIPHSLDCFLGFEEFSQSDPRAPPPFSILEPVDNQSFAPSPACPIQPTGSTLLDFKTADLSRLNSQSQCTRIGGVKRRKFEKHERDSATSDPKSVLDFRRDTNLIDLLAGDDDADSLSEEPSYLATIQNLEEQTSTNIHSANIPQSISGNIRSELDRSTSSTIRKVISSEAPRGQTNPSLIASERANTEDDLNEPVLYGRLQLSTDSASRELRRQRNTVAARKYRQKKFDRISELEQQLAAVEEERNNLLVEVERWKAKAELLQEMMLGQEKGGNRNQAERSIS